MSNAIHVVFWLAFALAAADQKSVNEIGRKAEAVVLEQLDGDIGFDKARRSNAANDR